MNAISTTEWYTVKRPKTSEQLLFMFFFPYSEAIYFTIYFLKRKWFWASPAFRFLWPDTPVGEKKLDSWKQMMVSLIVCVELKKHIFLK